VVRSSAFGRGSLIVTGTTVTMHGRVARRHGRRRWRSTDVAPLNGLVARLASAPGGIVAMKDPTRGGLASALHEMADKSHVGIIVDELALRVTAQVRAAGELLGIDPLHVANEGKAVLGVRPEAVGAVLEALRAHPLGRDAAVGRAPRIGSAP
jgi:hydrogenase expression/formation protein HypE